MNSPLQLNFAFGFLLSSIKRIFLFGYSIPVFVLYMLVSTNVKTIFTSLISSMYQNLISLKCKKS